MTNWLQKITSTTSADKIKRNLPATLRPGPVAPHGAHHKGGHPHASLPNASIIYGVAASVLAVIGVYFLMTGLWSTGFFVLLPAIALLGFALHFIKNR